MNTASYADAPLIHNQTEFRTSYRLPYNITHEQGPLPAQGNQNVNTKLNFIYFARGDPMEYENSEVVDLPYIKRRWIRYSTPPRRNKLDNFENNNSPANWKFRYSRQSASRQVLFSIY